MGGRRKNKSTHSVVRSAYGGHDPLVSTHHTENRTTRTQREISELNNTFSKFYSILTTRLEKYATRYDLHRRGVYEEQTVRLVSSYFDYIQNQDKKVFTMIDAGCGTGKLMRRMLRARDITARLASKELEMRMLGLDRNYDALFAAIEKKNVLLKRNPSLNGNLIMDFLAIDLINLNDLDLRKTVIGDQKVDLILVSDLFYWVKNEERGRVICALKKKLKDSGHLISMEFISPHVQPGPHLPRKWANCFNSLSEPMVLGELYELMRRMGFEEITSTFESTKSGIYDAFLPLHSLVFKLK